MQPALFSAACHNSFVFIIFLQIIVVHVCVLRGARNALTASSSSAVASGLAAWWLASASTRAWNAFGLRRCDHRLSNFEALPGGRYSLCRTGITRLKGNTQSALPALKKGGGKGVTYSFAPIKARILAPVADWRLKTALPIVREPGWVDVMERSSRSELKKSSWPPRALSDHVR